MSQMSGTYQFPSDTTGGNNTWYPYTTIPYVPYVSSCYCFSCVKCHANMQYDWKYCPYCGKEVKTCPKCGQRT